MKILKHFNSSFKFRTNNLFNMQKKNIYYNPKVGYYVTIENKVILRHPKKKTIF